MAFPKKTASTKWVALDGRKVAWKDTNLSKHNEGIIGKMAKANMPAEQLTLVIGEGLVGLMKGERILWMCPNALQIVFDVFMNLWRRR